MSDDDKETPQQELGGRPVGNPRALRRVMVRDHLVVCYSTLRQHQAPARVEQPRRPHLNPCACTTCQAWAADVFAARAP
jgi:hypothetical protein